VPDDEAISRMPKKKESSFADGFAELEQITAWFDSGVSVDLDEGLKKFERGLELAASLKKHLSEVENQVEELKGKYQNAALSS